MQETHPLRVFPDGGDEHVTSNLKVDSSGSRRTQTGIIFKSPCPSQTMRDQGLLHRDPGRLEPSTLRLEVTCSIQLSYGAKLV